VGLHLHLPLLGIGRSAAKGVQYFRPHKECIINFFLRRRRTRRRKKRVHYGTLATYWVKILKINFSHPT
jgi:hypothetical protein